jgi:hypothetical protein
MMYFALNTSAGRSVADQPGTAVSYFAVLSLGISTAGKTMTPQLPHWDS